MDWRELAGADIDKVRDIEGFPAARDADIIALSDAPYFTACPNPFIADFMREYGTPYIEATDDYHREPFAFDVSEGKNDPIYLAHSYHTKVPHKAIMRYILHYTKPGDIVLDGFCGTGMTGVAARKCGNPDAEFKAKIEREMPGVEWGTRRAVLTDLSPAAAFIAYNYNTPVDTAEFTREAARCLAEVEKECGWMYDTRHTDGRIGRINYTIWSDVFICPTCSGDIVFWGAAKDNLKDRFSCPHCAGKLRKADCKRAQEMFFDNRLNENAAMTKLVPVLINYSVDKKRFEKKPDAEDLALIAKIDNFTIPHWYPADRMCEGAESRRNDRYGITHVHRFYTRRALIVFAAFNRYAGKFSKLLWLLTATTEGSSKLNRERPNGLPSKLTGTLYISSMIREIDTISFIRRKVERFITAARDISESNIVSVQSCSDIPAIAENTIDYIFTDPPFGGNLNYSELSFLWESWLKVVTNQKPEAVMNTAQGKGLPEYQALMTRCFSEYYRVLKPGRWMTVEFHNSQNAVWNAIQEALQRAGFIIADVRTLDKQQSSFKQATTTTAVKQDLVISAYKPRDGFRREFTARAGSGETAWAFVRQHLEKLPVAVVKDGCVEVLDERRPFLLFDRMVAYHIMNALTVPLDSADFYKGLIERFIERDGMYFLDDQINEYDLTRISNDIQPSNFELLVSNEKTAIAWLYRQLSAQPDTYAGIQPRFIREWKTVDRFEVMPELSVMLEENFIQDSQGKWYVPDVTKAGDVAKLREKKLLREFDSYLAAKGKLKLFRTEAIRAGFAKLWADKNYKLIVQTAERLPEKVIAEDDKLLMYYDISLSRI